MKITNVEAIVLDTGKNYPDPQEAAEAHGVRFVCLIRITTDEGIAGWSDVETQPHVGKAIVDAPPGGAAGFESVCAMSWSARIRWSASGCGRRCTATWPTTAARERACR